MATNMPFGYWPDYFRKLDIVTFYYSVIAGVTHAVDYYRRAAQLEAELRQSQLEILKRQLQPHFLFNTLNAVNALIYEDPKSADRVVTRLGELLRMSLAVGNQQEVPLGYELEFVRAYLDIQQIRLGSRLQVSIDVPDELHDVLVPAMSLQPLVENAVIHGIGPRIAGGRIAVTGERAGAEVCVRIADTGVGVREPVRRGVGLTNVEQRLAQLYGAAGGLAISGSRASGTVVEVRVPAPERVRAMPARGAPAVEPTAVASLTA
jgi:LytS/YehU family sensor histidine kinase